MWFGKKRFFIVKAYQDKHISTIGLVTGRTPQEAASKIHRRIDGEYFESGKHHFSLRTDYESSIYFLEEVSLCEEALSEPSHVSFS